MEYPSNIDTIDPTGAAPPLKKGMVLLSVDRARVEFDPLVAVRDVSFELRGGDILGLIGPNGAGKTTLLRAIASLQPLSAGAVSVMGERILPGDEEAARAIGFTPDTPPCYETLTVREFLRFIASGYGLMPENTETLIDFWLEKVWLADKSKEKIKGLSRGMRQRLGIARTLMPNPQIVLLDEPASGLDPAGRAQFRRLLGDLGSQGKTLIVSSHILSDMEEYCTHIAMMSRGQMIQFGTVREVSAGVDDGRCRYTLDFAEPVTGVKNILQAIDGISDISVERLRITMEYWSDRPRAAALLRELIRQELPVFGFSANAAGLEEAYLRAGIRQVD